MFRLGGVPLAGAVFPFDCGFVLSTLGEDGNPMDVLVLMDEPAFAGCLAPARLIGVIQAEQTEDGETTRNDRLIAVPSNNHNHRLGKGVSRRGLTAHQEEGGSLLQVCYHNLDIPKPLLRFSTPHKRG